ncbi:unnamed protein product, partial [Phaeothamnion confervicola]
MEGGGWGTAMTPQQCFHTVPASWRPASFWRGEGCREFLKLNTKGCRPYPPFQASISVLNVSPLSLLSLFPRFFFLGSFVSALGAALPALARAVGQTEARAGMCILGRGIGRLTGSAASAVPPASCGLRRATRATLLAFATAGMGVCAVLVAFTHSLPLLVLWTSLQGAFGGAIDALSNCLITVVWGAEVVPWMQALHFLFSAGALSTPAAIGAAGYVAAFLGFAAATLPIAAAGSAWSVTADGWRLEDGVNRVVHVNDGFQDIVDNNGGEDHGGGSNGGNGGSMSGDCGNGGCRSGASGGVKTGCRGGVELVATATPARD